MSKGQWNQTLQGYGDGEPWSREQFRQYQFTILENRAMEAEEEEDWPRVLRILRLLLRMQMEVMKETIPDPEDKYKKIRLEGTATSQFQTMKERIKNLQSRYNEISRRTNDPATQQTRNIEADIFKEDVRSLADDLAEMNTGLGLNYRRKDIYEAWKD